MGSRRRTLTASNNRLQGTGTLKVGQASKVLFRSAVLRKRSPVPEPGVRPELKDSVGFSFPNGLVLKSRCIYQGGKLNHSQKS